MDLKYTRLEDVGLYSYVLGYGPVVGCCEHGDEIVGFGKRRTLIGHVADY